MGIIEKGQWFCRMIIHMMRNAEKAENHYLYPEVTN